MHKTTILIPILEVNDNNRSYFKECIGSIKTQKDKNFYVQFVGPEYSKEIQELTSGIENCLPFLINDSGKIDYASQINFASAKVQTEYFSVAQMDDTMFPNHVQNINIYTAAYPTLDCFNPLVYEVGPNDEVIGFSNETIWAAGNMERFGYFDLAKTKERAFYNFNINCFTVKTDVFQKSGMLKPSLKKFGDYEFLLRLLNLGKKVFVIPKMTYKHYNGITGSIHDLQKDMDDLEKKHWYNTSRKEYFFDFDREITYS